MPFLYFSLKSLSSTPLHYEVQLRFTRSKLIFILLDSFALQKIYITVFYTCCTLHENMHCIWGANTPRQVQLWQNDVHVHSRSLHRWTVPAWVFGGICRENKACFFVVVGQQDKDTFLAIIHAHILRGTNAMSDMWRALIRLSKSEPQTKLRVNPNTGAHGALKILGGESNEVCLV